MRPAVPDDAVFRARAHVIGQSEQAGGDLGGTGADQGGDRNGFKGGARLRLSIESLGFQLARGNLLVEPGHCSGGLLLSPFLEPVGKLPMLSWDVEVGAFHGEFQRATRILLTQDLEEFTYEFALCLVRRLDLAGPADDSGEFFRRGFEQEAPESNHLFEVRHAAFLHSRDCLDEFLKIEFGEGLAFPLTCDMGRRVCASGLGGRPRSIVPGSRSTSTNALDVLDAFFESVVLFRDRDRRGLADNKEGRANGERDEGKSFHQRGRVRRGGSVMLHA